MIGKHFQDQHYENKSLVSGLEGELFKSKIDSYVVCW